MLTDGKYEDISATTKAERRERRSRYHRFASTIFGLFSVALLLGYVFVNRERDFLYAGGSFAILAVFHRWLQSRNQAP